MRYLVKLILPDAVRICKLVAIVLSSGQICLPHLLFSSSWRWYDVVSVFLASQKISKISYAFGLLI